MNWIKVTDYTLPEHGVRVLVFSKDFPYTEILYYHKGAKLWKDPDSQYKTTEITHWMSLPDSPNLHTNRLIKDSKGNLLIVGDTVTIVNSNIIKDMETKQIKITPPEGFEIDTDKSTFECIVFKEIPKKPERITKWEDFKYIINGYYIDKDSSIKENTVGSSSISLDRNVWPTKELAEASLALCQLIRYRDSWNEGWIADWTNSRQKKYSIIRKQDCMIFDTLWELGQLLVFENDLTRKLFFNTFKDLIEIAKPLL